MRCLAGKPALAFVVITRIGVNKENTKSSIPPDPASSPDKGFCPDFQPNHQPRPIVDDLARPVYGRYTDGSPPSTDRATA